MRVLAVDTSGSSLSVALREDNKLLGEILLNTGRHHSETFLPVIDIILKKGDLTIHDVDLFACTTGPGSFTGLRIGVSTMKALALASGKPIVGVSTLAALAMNAHISGLPVCSILDAKRGQIFWGVYVASASGEIESRVPDRLSSIDDMLGTVGERTVFVGDGALAFRAVIEERLKGSCVFAPVDGHQVRASNVGTLGLWKFRRDGGEDPLTFVPRYLRVSAAEEKV
ncbi:MAG: tRNA (adenosine(37)-N6)-threonylcarbamoyltransferase complex dimerization subunit type 1 TsaB [Syntrophales bacterium]|nr:tRNA (adenosine(37)-N6)-threonylcarbamoyltransferase complex dimerization subunit type 1 TsaB [Syntrophales bacterium]